MEKVDLKRVRADLYAPSRTDFALVNVPPMMILAIDGHGDPNTSPAYAATLETLYPAAYAIKMASKRELARDFVVAPLEGLWSADDPAAFVSRQKDAWDWTMLIVQPDWITPAFAMAAIETVARTKDLPRIADLRVETFAEGLALQILHVGPYDAEGPTLARLHDEVMPARGLTFRGRHHEIYLSDARRTAPERLRTILRQPVRPIDADPGT